MRGTDLDDSAGPGPEVAAIRATGSQMPIMPDRGEAFGDEGYAAHQVRHAPLDDEHTLGDSVVERIHARFSDSLRSVLGMNIRLRLGLHP